LISRLLLSAVMLMTLAPSVSVAQEVTAEVRTWSGQTLTGKDPTLEIFYTILPSVTAPLGGGGGGYSPTAPGGPTPPGASGEIAQPPATIGVGSVGFQAGTALAAAAGTLLPAGPVSKQGRRQQDFVRLSREGAEIAVPFANLASLLFTKTLVHPRALPPYVALKHFRHGVTAVLADGSKIDGDYVNLGTALLRGATPQGTIDIPWEEIESVRFRR
jgi:hypothetical protein